MAYVRTGDGIAKTYDDTDSLGQRHRTVRGLCYLRYSGLRLLTSRCGSAYPDPGQRGWCCAWSPT
eukprot:812566-Rhodomonas_salina.1